MKKHTAILLSCAVAIAMLFSLVQVTPVKAVPPIPFEKINGPFPEEYIDCGDFQISSQWVVPEEGITHLDKDGNWVRSNVTVTYWVDYWRVGTDLEAHNNTQWTGGYTWDTEGNVVTAYGHGRIVLVHVPGYGPILRDTGYMLMNYVTGEWIDHGHNISYTVDEQVALCNYFSGE